MLAFEDDDINQTNKAQHNTVEHRAEQSSTESRSFIHSHFKREKTNKQTNKTNGTEESE